MKNDDFTKFKEDFKKGFRMLMELNPGVYHMPDDNEIAKEYFKIESMGEEAYKNTISQEELEAAYEDGLLDDLMKIAPFIFNK